MEMLQLGIVASKFFIFISDFPNYHLTLVSKLNRSPTLMSTTPLRASFTANSSLIPLVINSGLVPSCTRSAACRTYVPEGSSRRRRDAVTLVGENPSAAAETRGRKSRKEVERWVRRKRVKKVDEEKGKKKRKKGKKREWEKKKKKKK